MPKTLVGLAQRLADVLDLENDALRTMDLPRAAAMLAEKTAAIAALAAFGDTSLEPHTPILGLAARRLNSLVLDNRRLLERAIVAQQRVIGIIVRAATSTEAELSYGIPKGRRMGSTCPMAISTRV
jgi:hypothetical protein